MESPPGAETVIDGRRFLYFAGSSYLGLHGHPEVIEAACDALRAHGLHTATGRENPPLGDVAEAAVRFFDTSSGLYVGSGYGSNSVVADALEATFDAVFVDELAHYSVRDATLLSGRPVHVYASRDVGSLAEVLRRHLGPGDRPLVMTDGVFPDFGWVAPVSGYIEVLTDYPGAALCLDDSHSFGILGENGRGTFEHAGLWRRCAESSPDDTSVIRLFVCGTLSKAMGGFGGLVPGSEGVVQAARDRSRYWRGSASPTAPAAAATATAMEFVRMNPELREQLRYNIRAVRQGLRDLGLDVADLPTANVAVQVGDAENMARISCELEERGIIVPYFSDYSDIPKGDGCLRIAVFATHTPDMIEGLLETLSTLL